MSKAYLMDEIVVIFPAKNAFAKWNHTSLTTNGLISTDSFYYIAGNDIIISSILLTVGDCNTLLINGEKSTAGGPPEGRRLRSESLLPARCRLLTVY